MRVMFRLGKKRDVKVGTLVKDNSLTCWVRLENGDVILRHKRKHQVFIEEN